MKIKASVGILTFNSAQNIRRTLESVKDFEEIIVCDGGSSDQTIDIAKEYGAKIIMQSEEYKNSDGSLADYSGVRNQCLDNATYDWFLYIDSDEQIEKEAVNEIAQIVERYQNKATDEGFLIYNISPRIIYSGKRIEYSSNYPGWQKRFFNKKTGARFIKKVHERIEYDRSEYKEGFMKGHWNYFVEAEFNRKKLSKYAKMEVDLYLKKSQKSLFKMIFDKKIVIIKIILKSLKNYLLHGFKKSMPPKAEFQRVYYNLQIIKGVLKRRHEKR